jgi:hypothetical protein
LWKSITANNRQFQQDNGFSSAGLLRQTKQYADAIDFISQITKIQISLIECNLGFVLHLSIIRHANAIHFYFLHVRANHPHFV